MMSNFKNKQVSVKHLKIFWLVTILLFIPFYWLNTDKVPTLIGLISVLSVPLGIISYLGYLLSTNRKGLAMIELFIALLLLSGSLFVYSSFKGDNIKHDGTRTGPRVGYRSYCDPEGGYVIYENEKLLFVKNDGEMVYWTKDDIDCYVNDQKSVLGESESSNISPTDAPIHYPNVSADNESNLNLIECWGPDNKTFMTTQEKCDEFNTAWGKPTPKPTIDESSQNNSNEPSGGCDTVSIACTYQTSFGGTVTGNTFGCSYREAYEKCDEYQKNGECTAQAWTDYYACIDQCKLTRDEGLNICMWAYTGPDANLGHDQQKYDECSSEVWANYESCKTTCRSTRDTELSNCK